MNVLGRAFGRPQVSCRQVAKVLQAYLDGELDVPTADKLASHLDECRRCGLEAAVYDALKDSLHRLPGPLPEEPVARLREFGAQLARGEPGAGNVGVS